MPSDTIYIVVIDHGAKDEPELFAFDDARKADEYAGVRGSVLDIYQLPLMNEAEAERLIKAEAKERSDEERFERMREEGSI